MGLCEFADRMISLSGCKHCGADRDCVVDQVSPS
jgi:hypothetical protein